MVIVDTHVFIWDLMDTNKIPAKILKHLDLVQEQGSLFICSISLWEIGLLVGKGRIELDRPVDQFLKVGLLKRNYQLLEITPEISLEVSIMAEEVNKDPADRIIAASSLAHKAILITADKNLRSNKNLKTLW